MAWSIEAELLAYWTDAIAAGSLDEAAVQRAFDRHLDRLGLPARPCAFHDTPEQVADRLQASDLTLDEAWGFAADPDWPRWFDEAYSDACRTLASEASAEVTALANVQRACGNIPPGAWDIRWAMARDLVSAAALSDVEPWNPWCPLHQAFAVGLGLFWMYEEAVLVLFRPDMFWDLRGRLHCEHGPALRWRDGSGLYFWHGLQVPARVVMQPETLTIDYVFQAHNPVRRRLIIERMGLARLRREAIIRVRSEAIAADTPDQLEALDEVPVEIAHPHTAQRCTAVLSWPPDVHRDARGRFHCTTGPAVAWDDGAGVYFWHGVEVPGWAITDPDRLTTGRLLDERADEVQWALIACCGFERIEDQCDVETLDETRWGTLYHLERAEQEPLAWLKVVCPSTGQTSRLRVPPEMGEAHEAVAWTFGIPPEFYQPLRET